MFHTGPARGRKRQTDAGQETDEIKRDKEESLLKSETLKMEAFELYLQEWQTK